MINSITTVVPRDHSNNQLVNEIESLLRQNAKLYRKLEKHNNYFSGTKAANIRVLSLAVNNLISWWWGEVAFLPIMLKSEDNKLSNNFLTLFISVHIVISFIMAAVYLIFNEVGANMLSSLTLAEITRVNISDILADLEDNKLVRIKDELTTEKHLLLECRKKLVADYRAGILGVAAGSFTGGMIELTGYASYGLFGNSNLGTISRQIINFTTPTVGEYLARGWKSTNEYKVKVEELQKEFPAVLSSS